jgi:hypothetical protein
LTAGVFKQVEAMPASAPQKTRPVDPDCNKKNADGSRSPDEDCGLPSDDGIDQDCGFQSGPDPSLTAHQDNDCTSSKAGSDGVTCPQSSVQAL